MREEPWEDEAGSALTLAESAVARDAENAHVQRALAAALRLFPKEGERRRRAAVRAVELTPEDASNWYERWKAFGSCLDDGAIRRALELDSSHFAAVHDLGVALSEAGHHEKAVKLLSMAVALNPESPLARYNLAMVLARAGKEEQAELELRKAATLAPDDALLTGIALS